MESIDTTNPVDDIVFRLLQLWEDNLLYLQHSTKHNGYYINMICDVTKRPKLKEEFTLQLYPNKDYKITFVVSSYWFDANNSFIVLWVKECYKYLLPKLIRQ